MNNSPGCQTCELMDNCSFYWSYNQHPAAVERQLVARYCHAGELPASCKRIQYLKENKESPPPFISPEGDNILTPGIETSTLVLPA